MFASLRFNRLRRGNKVSDMFMSLLTVGGVGVFFVSVGVVVRFFMAAWL